MDSVGCSALHDRMLEQTLAERRCQQYADRDASRRLTKDGHIGRVATERANLISHPPERCEHVMEAIVALCAILFGKNRVGQKAQRTESVVDCDNHHISATSEGRAVVGR